MNINLHLTDDTELCARGFVAGSSLFAEVRWDFPRPTSRLGEGTLWGTPEAMRRLAAAAGEAAQQAEEEAAWEAHTARTAPTEGAQVA